MKTNIIFRKYPILIPIALLLWSCEDQIYPELPKADPIVVIDAWVNDKPEDQIIKITRTQPYFDNTYPPGVKGANVSISDNDNNIFQFVESSDDGVYVWKPNNNTPHFGKIGNQYKLHVQIGASNYQAESTMNRVPVIDSITYRFEKGNSFLPDSYFAQFYANDFLGEGDTYWIKAYKNGQFLDKPSEINLAFDAGFTRGGNVDGITFIQPVRDGINPFDQDENDNFLSPYSPGDSVYVEIYSITNDAFDFLNEVAIQTNREGGFGELFAQPLANVPSNITEDPETSSEKAVGFFNVSAVTHLGKRLDPNHLPTGN